MKRKNTLKNHDTINKILYLILLISCCIMIFSFAGLLSNAKNNLTLFITGNTIFLITSIIIIIRQHKNQNRILRIIPIISLTLIIAFILGITFNLEYCKITNNIQCNILSIETSLNLGIGIIGLIIFTVTTISQLIKK